MDAAPAATRQLDADRTEPVRPVIAPPLDADVETPQEFYRRITSREDIRAILAELADRSSHE